MAVSESFNIVRTEKYKMRVKAILATGMAEADRKREKWNLNYEAHRSQREATGLNESEVISKIIVIAG